MPTARRGTAWPRFGQRYLSAGGATNTKIVGVNEIYNTATKKWETGSSMQTARWGGIGAAVGGIL